MAAFPLEKRLSKWPDRWTRPRRFRRFDRKKCSVVDIFLRGKVTENSASTTTTIKMAELITRLSGNLSLHHVGKRKKKEVDTNSTRAISNTSGRTAKTNRVQVIPKWINTIVNSATTRREETLSEYEIY